MLEGEPIIAFVLNGKKFTDCESYTEVTSSVECKVRAAPSPLRLVYTHSCRRFRL